MNIQIQLCGMLILVLLFFFYKSHKSLQLYSEKIFYRTLCISIANLFLDIVSLVIIYIREYLPLIIVKFICKLYLVSLIWITVSALAYVLTDLFSEKAHKKHVSKLDMITFLQCIVVFLLPIHIFDDGIQVYTYGHSVLSVYGFALIDIAIILTVIIRLRKKFTSRRGLCVGIWMSIWVCAALIQFFNNQLLIIGFAGVVGVLILFVVMENPEANFDKKLDCFNAYALSKYLRQLFENGQEFGIFELTFGNKGFLDGNLNGLENNLRKLLSQIKKKSNIMAFKNINSDFVLISQDMECLKKFGEEMYRISCENSGFREEIRATLVNQGELFFNEDQLFHFLYYVRGEYEEVEDFFQADETVIKKYMHQDVVKQKIETALKEDRIEVFLQPIYSNHKKCFASAEALVRIREEDGSLLSPGVFIPVAEDSGQIVELGERVIEKVCGFLEATNAIELGIQYIEVNLSVIQCEMRDLAERIIAIVEKYNIDPRFINFEITETATISAKNILLENMRKLIEYGFFFSLDDFGKGESNLMYMVDMPVSIVKLDMDMTKAFFSSVKAKHVLKAVVGMAHKMELLLVAEGIESQEEIDGMCQEGIDYIQGYYYSKPLPMEAFLDFLFEKNK